MLRPPMSRVVVMLAGDIEVGEVTTRPGYLTDWQFNDVSSNFASGVSSEHMALRSDPILDEVFSGGR
ncbi:putative LRR receptor-like serine/threonine-protein kinase [Cocos nucifera]|uniref:Putative LRR receptor-like serine/threonine-protein kinase n=1 Tax=Cocos nucifera TaxID=13894 RepID=A0A8K0ID08_COCNU|nr:putative LRR receptor-like serine/threonine-protein kinase [Cocos nucifera]